MDLDQDGRSDIISGSWTGQIYWFRRLAEGEFAEGVVLTSDQGEPLRVGMATATFVADWHEDGDLDLVVGTVDGRVELVENSSSGKDLRFGVPVSIDLPGPQREENNDSSPVVADWNDDGKYDLLVGGEDGSVHWYRNDGTVEKPRFAAGSCLVPKSPGGWGGDQNRNEGDWGLRSKICVTDWNGDGKLDLLLGDLCGGFQGKPSQLASERREERAAISDLPELQRHWAECFRFYRTLPKERAAEAKALLNQIRDLKERITAAQTVITKYQPQRQSHGFVWLFLRR